jgi:hypothetical protein
MEASRPAISFIVRLDAVGRGETDWLTGVVERVRTGEKHRFQGAQALGTLIARLAAMDRVAAASDVEPAGSGGERS